MGIFFRFRYTQLPEAGGADNLAQGVDQLLRRKGHGSSNGLVVHRHAQEVYFSSPFLALKMGKSSSTRRGLFAACDRPEIKGDYAVSRP